MDERFKLFKVVTEKSSTNVWADAVKEWDVVGMSEDENCATQCVCGKEGIRYCYTIHNRVTGATLEPIGSQCIRKFKNEDLTRQAKSVLKIREFLTGVRQNYAASGWKSIPSKTIKKLDKMLKDCSVLSFLYDEKRLTVWERDFLRDIRVKPNLSIKEINKRQEIIGKVIRKALYHG